ncbi:MAG: ABC transporter permease [Pseudomonadota bacterium]
MFWSLIHRHLWRHKLRTFLTILGMAVAILAFMLLRSVVAAWYRGVDSASDNRLITRHAVSLTFSLPLSYLPTLRQIPGVSAVTYSSWFGGVYIDERNFFPRFVVGPGFLDMHPEFILSPKQRQAFERERRACVVGRRLVEKYGWRLGDQLPLRGNIFPGDWSFVIRGIYRGEKPGTDEALMFFHFEYLNEYLKKTMPGRADRVGSFTMLIKDAEQAADIARLVDKEFKNSVAETRTETEKSFQLGFVAMTKALLGAIEVISVVVVLVILTVLANTMAMSARERTVEYVVLKTLGFGAGHIGLLVLGESVLLALAGGALGVVLCFPSGQAFSHALGGLHDLAFTPGLIATGLLASLLVGVLAAMVPMVRVMTMSIASGLRRVG